MKLRRTGAFAALSLFLLAAGCGGGGGGENGAQNNASSGSGASAPPAGNETVKLTVASWNSDQNFVDMWKDVQDALNKVYPGIELDYQPVKSTEYNTALNTALRTNSAADIIQLRPYGAGQAIADAGYLEPIDGLQGLDGFKPDQLAAAQGSDGKQYGVPIMLSSTQLFYNKDIFDKYGLKAPATWDELIAAAETLKKNKVTPFAFGSKEGWVLSLTHGAIAPVFLGADFPGKFAKGEAKVDSPEFVKSIEALKSLTPYFPNNFEGLGMDDIRTMFATGQAAMVFDGSFEIAAIQALNPDIHIGIAPVPSPSGGQPSVSAWVDGSYAINKSSKQIDAAKKVLQFMTTKEFGTIVLQKAKSISPVAGAASDDELVSELAKLSGGNASPYFAVTNLGYGDPTSKVTLENSLQGMFLGKLTPDQVAKEVQKSVDTWFKAAGK
ncbi:ABC transporter substrate-binding protein [Paenibacillus humicola]|uniref:ABC transporter substrate-binding protein n=1 Tax=Paenibacillus humicola TaxID=3110540 RepID=UPI00237C0A60|nr:extracellular solute-binding protein [Paenibacillus humicola]